MLYEYCYRIAHYQDHLPLVKVLHQNIECDCYGAYLPTNTLWKGEGGQIKRELKVYFFGDKDKVLEDVLYNHEPLTPDVVMDIVTKYWQIDEECVPNFVRVYERNDADIRVQFICK